MPVAAKQETQHQRSEMTSDGLVALMSCNWQQIQRRGHVVLVVSKQQGA
jgi:hypothetical protein